MNDRIANPAPLGFFALGVFAWVISLPFAGWFAMDQLDSDAASMALQMAGIPLGIVAILAWVSVASVVLFSVLKATIGLRVDEAEAVEAWTKIGANLRQCPDP
jgi:succinate-acetate transporter protein